MSTPLSQALAELRRRHGDAVIRPGGSLSGVEAWPTGLPSLDHRLTPGGLPLGRVSLLTAASPGASGRLTLLQALTAIASRERIAVYLDLTGGLDPGYLADLGADLASLLVVTPPSGRLGDGFTMARSLAAAGATWIAVALPPGGGAAGSGWEPRLTALAEVVAARRAICLVGVASPPAALRHAASLAVRCSATGWHEAHGDILGLRLRLSVEKSRVGAPGEWVDLLLHYPRPFAAAEVVTRPFVIELPISERTVGAQRVSRETRQPAGRPAELGSERRVASPSGARGAAAPLHAEKGSPRGLPRGEAAG